MVWCDIFSWDGGYLGFLWTGKMEMWKRTSNVFLCITWVQPRFLFLKIYLFVFSKEYYVSCSGGHHRFSFNRYKNWHFVDLWNITHIISFNKSTLDRKEGAIMNGQSRDIATLHPQGTKKPQPNHKNKTQKTKKTNNTVAINDKWSRMVRNSPLETWYIINWHHIYSFWSYPGKEYSTKFDFNPLNSS
jgi:hypothetical protein